MNFAAKKANFMKCKYKYFNNFMRKLTLLIAVVLISGLKIASLEERAIFNFDSGFMRVAER